MPQQPTLALAIQCSPPCNTPSLQTAREMAGRVLDSSRHGLPTISNEDFGTSATRILKSTAKLLESAEAEKREPATGRTPPVRR